MVFRCRWQPGSIGGFDRMNDDRDGGRPPRKVLIVLLGAIGDVTRGLPLAVRIKRAWPDTTLGWAVEPASAGLVNGHPSVDVVHVFRRKQGIGEFIRFCREIEAAKYEVALDMQRHLKSGLTTFSSRAERRIGFDYRNSRELNWLFCNEHIPPVEHLSAKIFHYQAFADRLGLPAVAPLDYGLDIRPSELERAEDLLLDSGVAVPPQQRAALIVGATWESRRWPPVRYAETVRELSARLDLTCIVVGGPAETPIAQAIAAELGDDHKVLKDLTGRTTLRELAAVFQRVRLAIGSDSGPMHVAAAAGTRIVSLWGASSPLRSAPHGSDAHVLKTAIGCSPCYRTTCPGLGTLCMEAIPSAAVVAHVEQLLQATS